MWPIIFNLIWYRLRRQTAVRSRTTSTQMSFPETVSDSMCRNYSVVQTHSFISSPGGWSQTILKGKKPDLEVLGWSGCTCSVVVRPDGCTGGMDIQFSCNSFGGESCSQHTNCTLPQKLETSMALYCVTKLHILEWPFIVPSTRCTCVLIMLFNHLLDMPHLSGGWIMLTNKDVNKFVYYIWEK